jgi:tRNA1(Val) A37 N6-methylase TrmN6
MARGVTKDALFDGALTLFQPERGYRVNVDALLLAAFAARGRRARRAVDLGAGVGAVGLALVHLGGASHVAFVEREPMLARLAVRNLKAAGFSGNVVVADLGDGLPGALAQSADLVVCNPPYFEAGAGRPRAQPLDRAARAGPIEPFVAAAARALDGARARAVFVYPARSLEQLLAAGSRHALVAKRLRLVHARADSQARLALLELRRARPGGLVVEPPLVEWAAKGQRAPELSPLVGRAGDRK